jgi:threonine dehydratase
MSVAGVKKYSTLRGFGPNQRIVGILSGANMNFERTRFVAERAELGKETEATVAVKLKDIPGSFFDLYSCISDIRVSKKCHRGVVQVSRSPRNGGYNHPLYSD